MKDQHLPVTVVGSINADLTVSVARRPGPGETVMASGGGISPGGKGANQAVAAALQGAEVRFVGAVGDDAHAAPATAVLRSAGVDLDAVESVPGATGLAVITVDGSGENSIMVIPGANAAVDAGFVGRFRDTVAGAGIVLLQGEIPASGFRAAVEAATGRVVVNLAPVVEVDRDALLRADPLMANEHEAGLILTQLGHDGEVAVTAGPEACARALVDAGFASVILTLGAAGALVATPDGSERVDTPSVTPVDTTGAGDAFAGACVARLAVGDDLVSAARHAVRVGAYAVTGHGAQDSYPGPGAELPGQE
ncbi:ribokinase [Corynebacterium pygosceleis]|uniref:Ribokinase n=1 Tax=Corynebacterium pygosceleis TaxID=2800406 RepID=A0A9Q4C9T0_9CORY|nr:ribokinase [Corynebacterium pygosceleis]MCK7636489.1 ribokinase [Corynebacterium pygosceleis]MCK7675063.1 ribokinase [Corynebacterium pygosceleis]MCL0121474.1 ribokinase [Corynebacterium pygosceleis]MCX7469197.1 ribokinase [Corynebacterium pygosceleis]